MLQIHTQGHSRGALAVSDHLPMEVAVVIAYSSPFSSYTKEHQSPALLPPRWLYSMPDFFCSVTTKQMCMSRRAQCPSSQIMKVFYIDRGVLRQRGEGMPCQGLLMSFTSERSPAAEAGAVPLQCLYASLVWVWGRSWGHLHGYTRGIWHCPAAFSEDP